MADAPAVADLESYDSEIGTMVVRTPSKMNFALVIFRGIEDSYNVGADIDCRYTISGGLEVNTRDWVGLFKVGWRNQTDFICYEWAPEARSIGGHGSDMRASIKFQASNLPLDDGEFYQFCYVTSAGHVRGASTPFQFKQESMDDLVEVEDENGELLIIKTKTAVLEDQLKKSNELRLQLKQEIKILENEKDMLKRSEAELQKKLQAQKDVTDISNTKIKEIQEQLSDVSSQNDHLQGCIKALQERIEVVNQEKQSMESRLDDSDRYIGSLQEKIKALVNEKDSLTGRVKSLEEEKELYKGHFTSSEDTLQSYVQECERVKMALMEEQASKCRIKRELERVESEMLEQRKVNENILKSAQTEKENLSYLAERMRNAEDKLSAAEHCKMMLNEEVLTLKQAYEKVSTDLEDSKLAVDRMNDQQTSTVSSLLSRVADLSGRLISTEREAQELREEVARCRTDLRDATEKYERTEGENRRLLEERKAGASETDGPLYALQLAQQTLKERYAKLDKKNDELKRVVEKANSCLREMMEAEEDQKNEIRSLRERLLMGQEAYKEKYIEWEKLEAEIYRLKLGQSSATSRESLLPSDADSTAALNGEEAMKLLGRLRHLKILYTTEKKINDDLAEQLETKNQEIERLRSLVTSSYPPAEYATIPRPRPSNNTANKRTDPGTTGAGGHVAQRIDDHAAVYVTDGPQAEASVDGHCPSGLAHPLQPLPAPIIPERLHNTARLTSISKHHDNADVGLNGVTALMDDYLVNRGAAAASNTPSAPPAEQQYSSFAAAAATTAADPEEDRFEDAIGGEEYVTVKCPLCSYSCAYENVEDGTVCMDRHFELNHSSPDPAPATAAPANPNPRAMEQEEPLPIECPVCHERFSCFVSPQSINDHVEAHFN